MKIKGMSMKRVAIGPNWGSKWGSNLSRQWTSSGKSQLKYWMGSLGFLVMNSAINGAINGAISLVSLPAIAQTYPPYCQQSLSEMATKEQVRKAALSGDSNAQKRYDEIVTNHANTLKACRQQNAFKSAGIWLRLYPCDIQPGAVDEILDRIVNRGYSEVFVETFFNSQVLLPVSQNQTAWRSVLNAPGQENIDLLQIVIQKGRNRGLKVTSWLFALNVGKEYVQGNGKQNTIARNGRNQTTIDTNLLSKAQNDTFNPDEAFADPYHPTLRQDYLKLVEQIIRYRPDGIVFDYIRYPKGRGPESIANDVKDLWIYGEAAQWVLSQRALNNRGRELITRYLKAGNVTQDDVSEVDRLYPQEAEPQWHGRQVTPGETQFPLERRTRILNAELWRLAVGHAMQGVVDYMTLISEPVQKANIPVGAVFFPDGNQRVGSGYDSRLQMWDRFPVSIDRYPMVYAVCGKTDCIMEQIQRALNMSSSPGVVKPVIAGVWQQSYKNRPALDVQMTEIRQRFPYITSMSHFAYSWQEPDSDNDRKVCRSPLK